MEAEYLRNDIYFCECCAQFFDCMTDEVVDVKYTEMPADFALELMLYRQWLEQNKRQSKHKRQRKSYRYRN